MEDLDVLIQALDQFVANNDPSEIYDEGKAPAKEVDGFKRAQALLDRFQAKQLQALGVL